MQIRCDVCACEDVPEPGFTGETHCPDCGAVYEYDEGPRVTHIPRNFAKLTRRLEALELWRYRQQRIEESVEFFHRLVVTSLWGALAVLGLIVGAAWLLR